MIQYKHLLELMKDEKREKQQLLKKYIGSLYNEP